MAQVTIFKPAEITVQVIDGNPPVDQSAELEAVQAQLATVTAERAALQAKIDASRAKLDELSAQDAAADAAESAKIAEARSALD
jgi:hypothetical protein